MSNWSRMTKWAPWALMAAVLVLALTVGSRGPGALLTVDQRVTHIASDVKCPSCSGLSVAESDASTAVAARNAIHQRVLEGQSDAQIDSFLVSRYGPGILLRPPASGLVGVVWIAPVAVLVGALGIVAAVFWRRRSRDSTGLSPEDRLLVEAALAHRSDGLD